MIVEIDGDTHRTELGRRDDNRRDAAAQAARWRVLRVTKYALLNEPDDVEADLLGLLNSPPLSSASARPPVAPRR